MHPLERPIPRRSALKIVGGGVVTVGAAGALSTGLGAALVACGPPPPPVWVPFDVDVQTLPVDEPTEVPLTATLYERTIIGSVWVIRAVDDTLTVYDPRCTHVSCAYTWEAEEDRFTCHCHEGYFAKDGAVISGPPPKPLVVLPTRTTATGGMEVEVLGDYATPRPSG
jgi:succinate dehydrogenase / fumarate reductase iron-sulfur subunit